MLTKKQDLILMIVWPIVASIVSLVWETNFLISTILFYILPSVYLSFKYRAIVRKIFVFSLVVIPAIIVGDYFAEKTGSWFFPSSIFGLKLFGTTVFEVVLWMSSFVYFVVMFYEYFIDHSRMKSTSRKMWLPLLGFTLLFVAFLIYLASGAVVQIPYFYLVFGLIFAIVPILLELFDFPRLFVKFAAITVYFSYSSFLWEIVALRLHQWTFPGTSFIGWLEIFNVKFPFEEFLIWIILGAAGILSWYEYFDDDNR